MFDILLQNNFTIF